MRGKIARRRGNILGNCNFLTNFNSIMESFKKYLSPSIIIINFEGEIFTTQSSEEDVVSDPYGESGWWV